MALASMSARGKLNGLLFELAVEQRYHNTTSQTLETVYTFPLPWGAVLLGVEFRIGDKTLAGVVTAKRQAEQRYEEAIAAGDSPVMVEKSADGLYTVNLGNLKPGEEAVIAYRYAQLLRFEGNRIRLAIPTTIAPRYGNAQRDGGVKPHEAVDADLLVEYPFTLSIDIHGDIATALISSPSHTIATTRTDNGVKVTLDRAGFLDRDFVLAIENLQARSLAMVARDGEGYVALASICPNVASAQPAPVAVKLVVDCSGSMAGDSIASAKRALHTVLGQLDPGDRFTLSGFGSSVVHLRPRLANADQHTIRGAADEVGKLDANMGGTEMEKALISVFALGTGGEPADVLLITDGEIWKTEALVEAARRSSHRIFAVGVGSSPAESLLRRLAMETGGACELVSPNEDIAGAIVRMFARLRQPRVEQIAIVWPGAPEWITQAPSAMFDGETLHAFAGFANAPTGVAALTFVGDDVRDKQAIAAVLPDATDSTDTLARVAAFERMKLLPRGQEKLDLALHYQLITEETNLVVVHIRSEEDRATDLPYLQKIAHMTAAGWGGSGTVVGSVCRSIASSAVKMSVNDLDSDLEVNFDAAWQPAMQRAAKNDERPTRESDTTKLSGPAPSVFFDQVNRELVHLDGVPRFVAKLPTWMIPDEVSKIIAELAKYAAFDDEAPLWFLLFLANGRFLSRQAARAIQAAAARHDRRGLRTLFTKYKQGRFVAFERALNAALAMSTNESWELNAVEFHTKLILSQCDGVLR